MNPIYLKWYCVCRGRFDVWDDHDNESPSWHGSPRESRKSEDTRREREDREQRNDRKDERDRKEEREQRRSEERSDELRRVSSSANFGSERVLSSIRGLTMDDRERDR